MSVSDDGVLAELAPTGKLRSAINLGNTVLAQRAEDGRLAGVSVDLACVLADKIGVEVELFPFNTAGKAFEALQAGNCDMGFLAIDPLRAEDLDYSAPYVVIEGTYLVHDELRHQSVEELDRDGILIAAGRGTAYDLHLSRTLKHAKLAHFPSSAAAIQALLDGKVNIAAGVRQPLHLTAELNAGFHVLNDSFLLIRQALAIPKNRPAALRYVSSFVDDMKSSGFIAISLSKSGQDINVVAP
ncbi:amino acid ABC transporter substrate-binding periplasmic protein [Acetobacter nitrogenifigens DSM 23921 = NBRC 105050]|uniref:ABC transporter substrate-binding protein n=1 Tax=Acetobacter nitrogenifigens DSM 23921 = NBRC 105050 TaxID=1120919 RepID=A0A511XF48_9PROT|nr:transporter substrate-binding domain-containing protein [Acetobacter nitrogenifigens]GBQ97064.1 amino acid ABC transporter substrate-binding periplasmic protein [Acetobacter nitrogenifigens DSM 23921 = NBRC 105050]GEN61573.1 ABC transporter substrate-binding protein [Acetobacter nitrogenifigens DSM 23921 = NBRC 105050]